MTNRNLPEQIAMQPPARGNIPPRATAVRQARLDAQKHDYYSSAATVQHRNSLPKAGHELGMHDESAPYLSEDFSQQPYPPDDRAPSTRLPTSTRRYYPQRLPPTKVTEDLPRGIPLKKFAVACAGVLVTGMLLAFVWSAYAAPALAKWNTDREYGYPRIIRAEANVGHGTKQYPITRFIGINNGGMIEVVELQENDPVKDAKIHGYVITQLVGDHSDLIPITSITFADVNGDGKLDMEVVVNGTLYVLLNDGTVFVHQQ